jgi:hypothetical protein
MDKQLERFPGILMVGSIGMFVVGLLISAILPLIAVMKDAEDTATAEDVAANVEGSGFDQLSELYPDEFAKYWEEGATPANYADALEKGRNLYVKNACFQCHTQEVRLFNFETERYGVASSVLEQNNDLMHPQLVGSRRIGPDLARANPDHDAAWYVQYLWDPALLNPGTAMPAYPWLFKEKDLLNEDGFALIAYIQWLGEYQPIAPIEEESE